MSSSRHCPNKLIFVSVYLSFISSHFLNDLRFSAWILLLSASKQVWCISLQNSSQFHANLYFLIWLSTTSLSHPWKIKQSRKQRVVLQDISKASLDSGVNRGSFQGECFLCIGKSATGSDLICLSLKSTWEVFNIFPVFCLSN